MTAITTLELTAFGKFRNEKIELKQGLNGFYHHNEWGKSTVCDFIMFMLYGAKALSGKKLTLDDKHLEKYLPWTGDGYISGALELLRDGDLFRIERRVTAKGSTRLNVYKNGDVYGCSDPGYEFFGVDKDTFMRTFLVRQTDIRFERTADIEAALHNLVTTGDENVSLERAMKTLDKLQTPLQSQKQRGSGRIPALYGEISSAELELASLCREKTVLDTRLSGLDGCRAELDSLGAQSAELDKKTAVAEGNEAMRLVCELDSLDGEILECRSRLGGSPLTQIEKEYMQNAFSDRALAKTAAEQAGKRVADTRFLIDNAKNSFADYDTFEKNTDIIAELVGKRPRPNTALVIAGALAAVAGVALGIFVSPFCLALTLLGAVATLLGITVCRRSVRVPAHLARSHAELLEKYRTFTAVRDKLGPLCVHLEVYQKEYDDAQARLVRAEGAIAKISKDYGIDSEGRLMSRLTADGERARTEAMLQRLYRKRAELLSGRDEADIRRRAHDGDGSDLTPTRLAQLKLAVSEKAAKISQMLTALESVRVERERVESQISELNVTVLRLKDELAGCEYKNAVYTQVREALTLAGERIKGSYNPILAGRVSPILSALTGGRYSDVYVDKELGVRVKSEGEYRELGYFSRGTADCVYLAIRLCMADILCKDAPLILDDPFWSLDGNRLQNALALINKISESKQIILFGAR